MALSVTNTDTTYRTGSPTIAPSCGTAASDRWMVFTLHTNSATSTFTVNGGAAAIIGTAVRFGNFTDYYVYHILAAVPTGTTATIARTGGGSELYGIGALRIVGVTGTPTVTGFSGATGSGTGAQTGTVTFPDGALVVGSCGCYRPGGVSYTWTGLTELLDYYANGENYSTAAQVIATGETNRAISAAHSATPESNTYKAFFAIYDDVGGGTDDLTADDVEAASEVSAPQLWQVHALTGASVQSTSEVSAPALGQVHALTAASVESASEVSEPAATHIHVLQADSVEAASEVSAPALGQAHVLTATSVESASEVSAPVLAVEGTHDLTADDVEAASEVSAPELWQIHALVANSVQAASEVSAPALAQVHDLAAASVEAASEVSVPAFAQINALIPVSVEAASEVSAPALAQIHALVPVSVESASEVSTPAFEASLYLGELASGVTIRMTLPG